MVTVLIKCLADRTNCVTADTVLVALYTPRWISGAEALKSYTRAHPFDAGNGDAETVLDQLYQAYAESHESDPPEISEGFKELECFLETLPLDDNNAVFNLCCRLCTAYEEKAFRHGLLYGAHLMQELDIS